MAETSLRPPGRPRRETPRLILIYAIQQWLKPGATLSGVLDLLEREGLGSFPRNTLKAHLLREKAELDKQNSDPSHY